MSKRGSIISKSVISFISVILLFLVVFGVSGCGSSSSVATTSAPANQQSSG